MCGIAITTRCGEKTRNCKVITTGDRQSSRSQDPNVRPQGIDYCLGFVMDVSAMHSRAESVRGYRHVSRNMTTGFGKWTLQIYCVLSAPLTAFSSNSLSLSVRHHHRDGVTVSHNTRRSTSKLAIDAQHGSRSSICLAIYSVFVANSWCDRKGMSERKTM